MSDDIAQSILRHAEDNGVIEERYVFVSVDDDAARGIPVRRIRGPNGIDSLEVMRDVLEVSDARAPGPQRRRGTAILTELASFIGHAQRYLSPSSVVFADVEEFSMTCVFNEHPAGPTEAAAGWRDHRAKYTCPRSPEWMEWTRLDGKELDQDAFADHIECMLESLIEGKGYPAPTEVLQMARELTVLTDGTFQRQVNPTTGASILVNKTEHKTGSTQIPRAFLLAIPVFDGGTRYQVEARVRFKLEDGSPVFSYTLHRRTEIERDAFMGLRVDVAADTGLTVLAGKAG